MRNQPVSTLFGFLCLSLALLIPAQVASAAENGQSMGVEYHILAAEVAGQRGETQLAAQEYVKALRLAPTLELAERATQVAAYAEDPALTLEAASAWAEFAPDKLEPRIILMRVAVQLDQVQAGIEHGLFVLDKHPKGAAQAFRDIAHAMSADKGHAKSALAVMAGLGKEYDKLPEADYATGLLALRLDEMSAAVEAADRALAMREDWPDALLLKATALLRLNEVERAVAVVSGADLDDERQVALQLAFARLLIEAELPEAAAEQYSLILMLDEQQPEALYAMGILQINMGNDGAAYDHFLTLYEDVGMRRDISAFYLGGIEESRGNFEEALEWYERVTEGDRYLDAAQRKAFVLYKLGRMDEARSWLKELRVSQPDLTIQLYLAEGELLYEAGEFEEAMRLYNRALGFYPDEPDLLYGRSLIAERMDRLTLSERDLRRILELQPDDPRALNALGYILANHTERYEEALDYISRALAQTPEDAAVIDSMGWVQFRLGELDKALAYLNKAFDKMPDPEVAAHLGEVLWQLGRLEDAQQIFEKALRDDPEHPVLRDTIQRLTQ